MKKKRVIGIILTLFAPLLFFFSALFFAPSTISGIGTDNCNLAKTVDINWTHVCKIDVSKPDEIILMKIDFYLYSEHFIHMKVYDNRFGSNGSSGSEPMFEKSGHILTFNRSFYPQEFHKAPFYFFFEIDRAMGSNITDPEKITVSSTGNIYFYKHSTFSKVFQPVFSSFLQWGIENRDIFSGVAILFLGTGCVSQISGIKLALYRTRSGRISKPRH